jgi:hypothetical protein
LLPPGWPRRRRPPGLDQHVCVRQVAAWCGRMGRGVDVPAPAHHTAQRARAHTALTPVDGPPAVPPGRNNPLPPHLHAHSVLCSQDLGCMGLNDVQDSSGVSRGAWSCAARSRRCSPAPAASPGSSGPRTARTPSRCLLCAAKHAISPRHDVEQPRRAVDPCPRLGAPGTAPMVCSPAPPPRRGPPHAWASFPGPQTHRLPRAEPPSCRSGGGSHKSTGRSCPSVLAGRGCCRWSRRT